MPGPLTEQNHEHAHYRRTDVNGTCALPRPTSCFPPDGWNVVAAARDAAKTQETLGQLVGEAAASKQIFVRGGVDVTNPATLNAELFQGVCKVVVATGAVFGMDKEGKMGYLDNMTSERVDKVGNENIAAAAKKFLPTAGAPQPPPLIAPS